MNDAIASPLFKKLNLGAHQEIAVFNAPDSFESELKQLKGIKITRDPSKPKGINFGLAFALPRRSWTVPRRFWRRHPRAMP